MASILAGSFKAVGLGYPFYLDDTKVYQKEMIEYDSDGNKTIQTTYDSFDSSNSIIIYSPWNYDGDVYKRNISMYDIKKQDIENANKVLIGEKSIEDLVVKPSKEIKEIKNEIEPDELYHENIIEIRVYNEDKNKYEIRKENVGENVASSILYCAGVIIIGTIIFGVQQVLAIEIDTIIYEIKCKYKKEEKDLNVLKKKLKVRKDILERLVK